MYNDGIIHDERSFVRNIMRNRFLTKAEVQDIEAIMLDQYLDKKKHAEADNRTGDSLGKYLFFQGAIMGMLLAFKQVKMHYENEAWKQGVDPVSGEKIPGHGNAV